ncbi:MAG: acyltransferase [Candidatus Krumholzibacteriia bacterium]
MIRAFKRLIWENRDRYGRFNHVWALLRGLPGGFGEDLRARYLRRFLKASGPGLRVHEGVRIRNVHRLSLGNDVELGVDCFLQAGGDIVLGNDVMLGPGVKIWSVNHRYDDLDRPIREQGWDRAQVTLGDGVWLGANVFVMPGVEIPRGCVVTAGSVVHRKRYPEFAILAGFPARVIGHRRAPGEAGGEAPPAPAPPAAAQRQSFDI